MTFDDVIEHFGSRYMACKALGIAHQNFTHWQKRGYIPIKHQFSIQSLTDGALMADSAEDYMDAVTNNSIIRDNFFGDIEMDELTDFDMMGSALSNATIENEIYVRPNLKESKFSSCDFKNVVFKHADFTDCVFSNCSFDTVRFDSPKETVLSQFNSCKFDNVEFVDIDMEDLKFNGCDLNAVKVR